MSSPDSIFTLAPSELTDHPLLAAVPMWEREDPAFRALCGSMQDRGQDYEVLIDRERRVVDGRNRRNACATLGRPVRCRIVADDEAVGIMLSTLNHRRHFTKGARAYLAIPFLGAALEERQLRKLANLRKGDSPIPIQSESGNTVPMLAAGLGFSADLIEQARKVRDLLAELPDLQPGIEGAILAGEMGLGGAIVAITNHLENAARMGKLGKRNEHARLFGKAWGKLSLHWTKGDEAMRAEIRDNARAAMLTWPRELVAEVAKIAAAADRELAKQAKEAAT